MKKKRIYLKILIIFLTLILFGISGIFNSCSFLAEELNEATTVNTDSSETITETTEPETQDTENTGSANEEETAPDTTEPETKDNESTTPPTTTVPETTTPQETTPEPVSPTVKLRIYEGPNHSLVDDICYYRVEAIVTGTPTPTVTFSKDDSNGVWGKYKAQVNLSKTNPDYTLIVTAQNSAGIATDSIKLSWGCGPLIIEKTMEFNPSNIANIDSVGTIDNQSVTFGDSEVDKDVRGFFAFDVSSLKGKNIISASLKLIDPNTTEKIDFKGNIQIWYIDFLAGGITSSDYMNIPYSGPQSFKWNTDPIQFTADFLKNIIVDRANAERKLEFGIWFADSEIGGNNGVREVRIYHTNDIILTVVYSQ